MSTRGLIEYRDRVLAAAILDCVRNRIAPATNRSCLLVFYDARATPFFCSLRFRLVKSQHDYRTLALIAVCLIAGSCSNPNDRASQSKDSLARPTKLVFGQRLLDSNLKLLTAFADINRDGKPDMILGSNGHVFSEASPRVKESITIGEYRHYVSHLLNVTDGHEIVFDEPYWPNSHGDEGQLTGG